MAKELRRRWMPFVGPTTAYAAHQATGMVDDHLAAVPRTLGALVGVVICSRPVQALPASSRQRPSNSGCCLATKASTAARWSSVPPVSAIISASNASDSAKSWPAACSTERRIAP